ncbi:hypothetical protein [uncultured Bacteroides sp.]|uniref:hypothetical protein n=1 Tax=uncultured Bacteroides sp. TaxID=162156 RepID=UPI0026272045|nr:hypothetical protein [uncultured Bacteroides sp.]
MKILIINYKNLILGGIEHYLLYLIQNCLQKKFRIIWLTTDSPIVDNSFAKFVPRLEKVVVKRFGLKRFYKTPKIQINNDDEVIFISFSTYDFIFSERVCRKNKINAKLFYILPHFKGVNYYYEDCLKFGSVMYKIVVNHSKKFFNKLINNNSLFCFADKQVESINTRYDLNLSVEKIKIPPFEPVKNFDLPLVRCRFRSKPFTIISVGRFEFPHKGYLIGLIDAVATLIIDNYDINLKIVGHGPDKEKIMEKINSFPEYIKKHFIVLSPVSPLEIADVMNDVHMSISLAGAVSQAARNFLISVPVRHWSYSCECYGFLPESKANILSIEKGIDVKDIIKQVYKMDEASFILYSRKSYETFNLDIDQDFILNQKNVSLFRYNLIERISNSVFNSGVRLATFFSRKILKKYVY